MIKNVVFDFGQVLVHFSPKNMVKKYVSDEDDVRMLADVIFDRLYWDRLDEGSITDEEVVSFSQARLPQRLHGAVPEIYYNWIYNLPEIEGMRELTVYLKERYGVRMFLLSNISTYFAKNYEKMDILRVFDKLIFSAVCKKVKPNADIFEHLCNECEILPEETLFIDDSEKNIKGAEAYGISGYLFDGDVLRLREYLDNLLGNEKNY